MSESESQAQVVVIVPDGGNQEVVEEVITEDVPEEVVENKELTVEIEEEEVPLAVVEETETIEEEEAPLASGTGEGLKNWWWWIAAGVAGIAGKGAYDANRRRRNKNPKDSNK